MKKITPYAITLLFVVILLYSLVQVVEVHGDSMSPLIMTGQTIYGVKSEFYRKNNIVIADINVNGKTVRVVKRIYATAGDRVTIIGQTVKVNGKVVKVLTNNKKDVDIVIEEDEYFLLGDNPSTTWMIIKGHMITSRLEILS